MVGNKGGGKSREVARGTTSPSTKGALRQTRQVINVPLTLVHRLLTDDTFRPCPRPINIELSSRCWLFKEVTRGEKPKRRPKGADIYVNSGGASGGRLLSIPGSLGDADTKLTSIRRRYGRVTSMTHAETHWKYHQYSMVRRNTPDDPWQEDKKGIRLYYIQPPDPIVNAWSIESKTLPGMPPDRLLLDQQELEIVQAEMMYQQKHDETKTQLKREILNGSNARYGSAVSQTSSLQKYTRQYEHQAQGPPVHMKSEAGIAHPMNPDYLTIVQAIQMLADESFKPGSRPTRTGASRIHKEWHVPGSGSSRRSRSGILPS